MTPDWKAWVGCPMPPNTSEYTRSTCSLNQWVRSLVGLITSAETGEIISLPFSLHAEIVEVEIEVVSPSIVPSGNFGELNRTVTCMVLKANDRRTSCPCHDEFRGPRSDCVRQVASENNNNNNPENLAFIFEKNYLHISLTP
ncbi:hypothetical protein TNCV_246731 [Trichonephila clavipes]|nr:hypothetical protein TNCV_246731 [Trichonephila clavipes]